MFSFLKKTWRQEDSTSHTSPRAEDADQPQSQPSIDVPSASKSGSKRLLEELDPESKPSSEERPSKAPKTGTHDSIRNHLPEIVDSRHRDEAIVPLPLSILKDQIFECAKIQNTIAVLPSTNPSFQLLIEIVSWSVDQERVREASRNPRTAIVVVEDTLINKYSAVFDEMAPSLVTATVADDAYFFETRNLVDLLKKDLFITTPNCLLESLLKGRFSMTQAHLLVICDAQVIRNQDSHHSMPIVRVMNDFYRPITPNLRPRVFGLAFLSSDRRLHFDSKMLKLEQCLDAEVFGVTNEKRTEILALPDRPDEIVILYDNLHRSTETRLLKQLRSLDPTESLYRRHFISARLAHDEVGPCASDLVWRHALKDMDGHLNWFADSDDDDDDDLDDERRKSKMRNIVRNWPFTMPNLDATSRGFNVSHKFLRLIQVLLTFKSYGDSFRGIVFVHRRAIALVLADLLRNLHDRLGFLRPQGVVGSGQLGNPNYYQEIFDNFASGVFNLLIATKSIEDLDVPKASVVIRYDLFESQTSHAYVRARTRGRESHLIHMAERGNDIHRRILSRITNIDAQMLQWTEALCSGQESAVPPASLQETINPYHSDSEDDEEGEKQYVKEPATNGRIYSQDATTVLYRYAASVRPLVDEISENHRLFEFEDIDKIFGIPKAFRCTINLPGTPIHKTSGVASSTKADARRSACFKACESLYHSNLLDFRLVPLPSHLRAQYEYEVLKPFNKTISSDVKSGGTRTYPRQQPNFWTNARKDSATTFYPLVFYMDKTTNDTESFGPIAILTHEPLPHFHLIRLFSSGATIPVRSRRAAPMVIDDEEQLKIIHAFSVRLCRAIMNKALICNLEDMAYFFLPLTKDWQSPLTAELYVPDISKHILWDVISLASKQWAVAIRTDTPEDVEADLEDAIIQDRWIEFTRRYRVVKVRRDLTPLSKPDDSIREAKYDNLWHFCKSKRKGLEGLKDFEQPIVEVAKLDAVLNHLNPTCKSPAFSSKLPAKYLIPELCAKFTVPASTMRMAMLLPSLMRRVDDLLLVKDMNAKFFDHVIREDLLHNALCTPAAGLEYDYERLELLGDAFLKYLASVYVFVTNPSLTEGALHVSRQKIISNRSLLLHASRIGMPAYIQSKVFAYKGWHPPNFRHYIPPKVEKEVVKVVRELEPGEILEDDEAIDLGQTTLEPSGDGEQTMGDMDEDVHIDEDTIQEQLLPCSLEPVELEEAVVEPDTNEDLPNIMDDEREGKADDEPEADRKEGPGLDEKAPTADKAEPTKKPKPKKKKTGSEEGSQSLGDKAIADVAEAIIGAAYISGGREAALQVTKSMTLPLSHIDRWSDFGRKVLTPPPNFTAKLRSGSIAAIEQIIGHKFNRPHLLAQAMTHSSIQGYEITSYERLEFIGDAILDFMVIRHIYDRDQQLSPGALTMLKGAMVSNSALAAVCVCSKLYEYLLFESSQLEYSIRSYVVELNAKRDKEYELAKQESRSPGQYWLEIEPPKALSDVVESIIGAIYISDNFSPVGAESLFDNVLKPFYDTHITLQTLSHHPTKILFELLQAQGCQSFELAKDKEDSVTRCYVVVHDVILASGDDLNPATAARLASFSSLDALEGDPDFMTRTCDCRTHHKKTRKKTEFEKALEKAMAKTNEENKLGDALGEENPQKTEEDTKGV